MANKKKNRRLSEFDSRYFPCKIGIVAEYSIAFHVGNRACVCMRVSVESEREASLPRSGISLASIAVSCMARVFNQGGTAGDEVR